MEVNSNTFRWFKVVYTHKSSNKLNSCNRTQWFIHPHFLPLNGFYNYTRACRDFSSSLTTGCSKRGWSAHAHACWGTRTLKPSVTRAEGNKGIFTSRMSEHAIDHVLTVVSTRTAMKKISFLRLYIKCCHRVWQTCTPHFRRCFIPIYCLESEWQKFIGAQTK